MREMPALLIDSVFRSTARRHVYAEVSQSILQAIGAARYGATLVTFPGKLVIEGEVSDQIVLSLSRSQWTAISERFRKIGFDAAGSVRAGTTSSPEAT